MSVVVIFAVILFLISVNALYVAAEFAAVGARRSRVRVVPERATVSRASYCRSSKTAAS